MGGVSSGPSKVILLSKFHVWKVMGSNTISTLLGHISYRAKAQKITGQKYILDKLIGKVIFAKMC